MSNKKQERSKVTQEITSERYLIINNKGGFLKNKPVYDGAFTYPDPTPFVFTEDVFEAYAENNTPGAYRIFWYYGPGKNQITILAITPHP